MKNWEDIGFDNIYVFDNNSTDGTAQIACESGATVIKEYKQGKGFVIQSMFNKVEADIYLVVDGDNTYDLSKTYEMVLMVINGEADMVVGNRLAIHSKKSFRLFHTLGNKLVRKLVNSLFKANLKDIMSGLLSDEQGFCKKHKY